MRWPWVSTVIVVVVVGGSFGAVGETATLKPVDLGVKITDGHGLILRGSPNIYTVTVTNRGPTTVSRLRLRVVTRLVSASYDFATGAYHPASGMWSGLSLKRGGRVTLTVSGDTPTSTGTLTATAVISPVAGFRDPARGNNRSTDKSTIVTP
jgi:hypothetical protein